ncbi:hypothetical protein DM02DRAFT_173287 [Periconia macrospinosa]|uniref:Uncharacterized protein n=1 Tax=Periconia macrospinosa TaxID=97972 RepID=A0A2V1DCS2_9PLEO|nr:hypothetical protein DM02DRAFT_173287 [Periconia macrospinosa]
MAGPTYTIEQLQHLRESPLVKKPDNLPSIAQWAEQPVDHEHNTNNNNNNVAGGAARRARPLRGDAAAEALNNPMGQFARRQSMQPGEETVLGPPKFNFASATRAHKHKESTTAITSTDGEHLGDRFPKADRAERWRDRDGDRTREKGHLNGRRGVREDGESWTGMKGRKSLGQEDFDRGFGRNGDRDADNGDGSARRPGNTRWGRRDENTKEGEGTRFGAAGQGGWRDRERNREREKDREWTRGGPPKEEDPEWMDTPTEKKEAKQHTQEDFQRWLEQSRANKGNKAPVEEAEELPPDGAPAMEDIPVTVMEKSTLKMAVNTPTLEANLGNMFGTWAKEKPVELLSSEPAPPKAKPDKKSRFMTMFAKPEEPAVPLSIPSATPASPAPASDATADREGFNRILQMLGTHNLGAPPAASPATPQQMNDTRQGGVPLDFPHYSPPPQDAQKPRPPPPQQPPRTNEQQAMLENILAQRPAGPDSRPSQQARMSSMSPDNALNELFRAPRAEPKYPGDDYALQQPPSRNHNMQDPNLAAILNNRPRDDANRERESKEFLLTLMQQPRNTPPQMQHQNLPRQPMENQNLPFFDQPGQRPQGQPKGRGGPPPGFMEDHRMLENEIMRREAELRQHQIREFQQQEAMRNKNRGMPMGFPGQEDPAIAGLQRRNTAGEIPRQMTNMGIPSQPHPEMPYMGGGRQPGMPPTPQDRPNIAPPPGFGMRQPPGLGGPQQQQQQMGPLPSFSAGNTPLGHPPGFPPPPGSMRGGGGFPGGPGGAGGNGMQGPPPPMQGYFPPPGYGPPPPMQMRGDDPRMMFEQQFGGAGGPGPRQQQGRPGPLPPPNMY